MCFGFHSPIRWFLHHARLSWFSCCSQVMSSAARDIYESTGIFHWRCPKSWENSPSYHPFYLGIFHSYFGMFHSYSGISHDKLTNKWGIPYGTPQYRSAFRFIVADFGEKPRTGTIELGVRDPLDVAYSYNSLIQLGYSSYIYIIV